VLAGGSTATGGKSGVENRCQFIIPTPDYTWNDELTPDFLSYNRTWINCVIYQNDELTPVPPGFPPAIIPEFLADGTPEKSF
jgi:hypothetical protein